MRRGEVASRDETVVRALTSNQGGPGSIPTQSHMWIVMLVLALLRGFFFRYSGLLSLGLGLGLRLLLLPLEIL